MTSPRLRRVLLSTILLLGLGIPAAAFNASTSFAQPASVEDPQVKATDLTRAKARGDVSPDRLVVVYRTQVVSASASQARDRAGASLLRTDDAGRREVLRAPSANAAALAAQLKLRPDVLDAYPDHVVRLQMAPNDPMLTQQWGLAKIGASSAWDTTQGAGTSVAVLDCGIHSSHPDLAGQVILEHNLTPAPTTDDLCNHGTHVAGTIAAIVNNGIGGAGVAPEAHLINVKVLDDTGSGFFSDVATGIEWAADNGARVVNMSFGGAFACDAGTQQAVNYAWNKGVVLVAAAGNAGVSGAEAPANCQNVIGVGATDENDAAANFSNFGPNVDVAAPGVDILSTVNPALNNGSLYEDLSGTSMAAPHVSGLAALLASTTYGANPSSIRDRLFSTAAPISGTGTNWTYGRIAASAAVAGTTVVVACTPRPPVSVTAASNHTGGLTTSVAVSGAGNTLRNLQFGTSTNGLIEYAGFATSAGGFSVPMAAGTAAVSFTVVPATPGLAPTVPFTISDGCGSWPTFVGVGPNALGPTAAAASAASDHSIVPTPTAVAVMASSSVPRSSPATTRLPSSQPFAPAPAPSSRETKSSSVGSSPAVSSSLSPRGASAFTTAMSGPRGDSVLPAQPVGNAALQSSPTGAGSPVAHAFPVSSASSRAGVGNATFPPSPAGAGSPAAQPLPVANTDGPESAGLPAISSLPNLAGSRLSGTVDPSQGGALWSSDGSISLDIPPSALPSDDWQVVLEPETTLTQMDPEAGLVEVGDAYYQVSVLDGAGAPVTNFDPALLLTVQPGVDELAAAGGDFSQVSVGVLDSGSGVIDTEAATVNDDGSRTVLLPDLRPAGDGGST